MTAGECAWLMDADAAKSAIASSRRHTDEFGMTPAHLAIIQNDLVTLQVLNTACRD